jgi:hypothetical protein
MEFYFIKMDINIFIAFRLFAQKKLEMKKKMEQTSEKSAMLNASNNVVKKSPKSVDQILNRNEKRTNQVNLSECSI